MGTLSVDRHMGKFDIKLSKLIKTYKTSWLQRMHALMSTHTITLD